MIPHIEITLSEQVAVLTLVHDAFIALDYAPEEWDRWMFQLLADLSEAERPRPQDVVAQEQVRTYAGVRPGEPLGVQVTELMAERGERPAIIEMTPELLSHAILQNLIDVLPMPTPQQRRWQVIANVLTQLVKSKSALGPVFLGIPVTTNQAHGSPVLALYEEG